MTIKLFPVHRYIYVKYNLGTHTASMRTRRKITLQQWHSLYVRRENKEAVMRLDGTGYYIGVRASGPMSKLDVTTDFFLGGVPVLSTVNPAALKDVTSQRDFHGCIQSLKVMLYFFICSRVSDLKLFHGGRVVSLGSCALLILGKAT